MSFTPHGLSHVTAVEQNYDWLLADSDVEQFKDTEIFLLLVATLLHDITMIPTKPGLERISRANHTSSAGDFLLRARAELGIDTREADAIGDVIRAHGVDNFEAIRQEVAIGNELIDIRKLGACLCMGDITHADSSRAPEVVLKRLDLDEESRFHWRRHMQISGITRKGDILLMSALTFSDEGEVAVKEYEATIQRQLSIIKPYFSTVLAPLNRVELHSKQLESPLDQTLTFKTNTPAVLKLLIDGVYEREDVFVRELVQNSLDSCLIRMAKELRRGRNFEPSINIVSYRSKEGLFAIRVDDNGVGMDIHDVQDTVLWIGSSISNREDVETLLSETIKKSLIATFGIGLLSCFKCSKEVQISSCKENATSIQFSIKNISEAVNPEKSTDTTIGTSVLVLIDTQLDADVDADAALEHYLRSVTQCTIRHLSLTYSEANTALSRAEIAKMCLTEATLLKPSLFGVRQHGISLKLSGEDYSGELWFDSQALERYSDIGRVEILNEGVYVCSNEATDWLPDHLSFCSGYITFASKALDLPASRDKVIRNEKYRRKSNEIAVKSLSMIDSIVQTSKHSVRENEDRRARSALWIATIYDNADAHNKVQILRRIDEMQVESYKTNRRFEIQEIVKLALGSPVYLRYAKGRWVEDLAKVDGKQLYHKQDDLVELQASMMVQDGFIVLSAARSDAGKEPVLESSIITAYLQAKGIKVIDLVTVNVIEGKQKSNPVPYAARQALGGKVKFVEIPGLRNKKGWKVGGEVWINIAHPQMESFYLQLSATDLTTEKLRLSRIITEALHYNYDSSMDLALELLADL